MDREDRKQELIDFVAEYEALCLRYDCAINTCGNDHLVDFTVIRALKDYRKGEIEEGLEAQFETLLDTIDNCLNSDNYQPLDDDDEEN